MNNSKIGNFKSDVGETTGFFINQWRKLSLIMNQMMN